MQSQDFVDFKGVDLASSNDITILNKTLDSLGFYLSNSEGNYNNLMLNVKPSLMMIKSMKPVEPGYRIFKLIPKYEPSERKRPKYLIKKPKEPKFVPYEPYKGSIIPIVHKKQSIVCYNMDSAKSSKNNIEIQELVEQMTELRTIELNKKCVVSSNSSTTVISKKEWEKEKNDYEVDIKNLRESNNLLQNQFKLQAQINSELKTLLVAAVGEDLETRVQHLTEDKLQLARALLKSTDNLTSHQEEMEWLAGQCEVWRSKFLASSLMVEELAKWKSALTYRIRELQKSLKDLLDESTKMRDISIKINCNLRLVSSVSGNNLSPLVTSDIQTMSNSNLQLSTDIARFSKCNLDEGKEMYDQFQKLLKLTFREKTALKLLQNSVQISNKPNPICNALIDTAGSLRGEQFYLQDHIVQHKCCARCKGEIKEI